MLDAFLAADEVVGKDGDKECHEANDDGNPDVGAPDSNERHTNPAYILLDASLKR